MLFEIRHRHECVESLHSEEALFTYLRSMRTFKRHASAKPCGDLTYIGNVDKDYAVYVAQSISPQGLQALMAELKLVEESCAEAWKKLFM